MIRGRVNRACIVGRRSTLRGGRWGGGLRQCAHREDFHCKDAGGAEDSLW